MTFNVYGFNSSRFDLSVLIPYLEYYAQNNGLELKLLKKGSRYFNISIGKIIFKDILSFSAPCSLEKYLANWFDGGAKKSIFPYQYFRSIEQIRECLDFPPREAFWSDLKKSIVSIEEYDTAKSEYNRRRQLAPTDPDYMANFSGWLRYYQMLDVVPLTRAIENSFKCFFNYFGNNPLLFRSLPALAFKAAFSLFDKTLPCVSSFSPSFDYIRQIFRNNQYGGLTNIYHRRVVIGADGPSAATTAPNGDPYSFFSFWDFNALYLFSQDQELPLGPGLVWEKTHSKFYSKKPMVQGVSRAQIEWLTWVQTQSICVDSNGVRQTIQHAMNFGEYEINGRPVDGYMVKDGVQYFFEFNGCYFHPGCCVPDGLIKDADKKRRIDQIKLEEMRSQGKILTRTRTIRVGSHVTNA